jgi:hypothetical protein
MEAIISSCKREGAGGKKAYQHSKGRGVFCDADAVGEGLLTGFLPERGSLMSIVTISLLPPH